MTVVKILNFLCLEVSFLLDLLVNFFLFNYFIINNCLLNIKLTIMNFKREMEFCCNIKIIYFLQLPHFKYSFCLEDWITKIVQRIKFIKIKLSFFSYNRVKQISYRLLISYHLGFDTLNFCLLIRYFFLDLRELILQGNQNFLWLSLLLLHLLCRLEILLPPVLFFIVHVFDVIPNEVQALAKRIRVLAQHLDNLFNVLQIILVLLLLDCLMRLANFLVWFLFANLPHLYLALSLYWSHVYFIGRRIIRWIFLVFLHLLLPHFSLSDIILLLNLLLFPLTIWFFWSVLKKRSFWLGPPSLLLLLWFFLFFASGWLLQYLLDMLAAIITTHSCFINTLKKFISLLTFSPCSNALWL